MSERSRALWRTIGWYALCVAAALVVAALLIALTGGPWQKALTAYLDGALRRPGRWGITLTESAPLLLVALGSIVASRAGLVNIGQEGQVLVGAATAMFVGAHASGPLALIGVLLAGAAGGALWAGIAAALRYARGVPEVISTLLLVFIAAQLVGYLLNRSFLLLDPTGSRLQTSKQLTASTRIGRVELFGNSLPWSVLAAVAIAASVSVALNRSQFGFRLTVLGANPRTAQRIGVPVVIAGSSALALSGALAGLAGSTMLATGTADHRLTPGFSNNVGWQGLLLALVARNRPLACVPLAFVFATMRTGSSYLAATGVPRSIVEVVRALLVLALLIPPALDEWRRRRARPDVSVAPTAPSLPAVSG